MTKFILFEKAYYTDGTGNPIGVFASKAAYKKWVATLNSNCATSNTHIYYKYSKENEWYYDDKNETLLIPCEVGYHE